MALCLHTEKKYGRCVYRTGKKKLQLAPPVNSHCGQRTLQAWPGRYGAFFLLLFPFCLARENMVVVPMFDRVHKDWFDVCLCLWIVKTIVLPESGHDPLARRSFSILRIFMSAVSPDVRCFNVVSWRFVFMGCLWWDLGSDFLVLLWSCPPTSYAVTVPKTRWSLLLQKWWGIWVVRPFLQIGCVVVTVSASSCLAGGVTSMLFTISQTAATVPVKQHMQE